MSSFAASSRVAAAAGTTRRVSAKPKRVRATRVVTRASGDDKADKPDGMIDRDDLDGEYYKGFVSSGIGPDDDVQVDGRDTLSASMKLAAQTASVLTMLTAGFMYSNGIGPFAQ
jgi:hypothetical protein